MIITGENTKLMSKSTNPSSSGHGSSSDPPPSYQPAQVAPSQPYSTQHYVVYHESPRRRFWRAFAVAILIWFLLTMLAQSIYSVARWSGRNMWNGDYLVPSNIVLSHCANGGEWSDASNTFHALAEGTPRNLFPYTSSTSFELPLSYKTFFLLSRGSQTYGTVNVVTSEEVSDVAKVHFTVKYYSKYTRDQGIKVCLIKRASSDIGVGFFTRQWLGGNRSLYYEATVVLPKTGNPNTPLQIENFETDVPNTSHRLGDLRGFVNFTHIDLKGSNAPIYANSIFADTAAFRTTNSPILGVHNTSRSLTLTTSNSPIQVDVGVENKKNFVSELVMRTSNGKIDSRVSLTTASHGGRYLVTARTSNGPLNVNFPTSPLDSTLKLVAATSNSLAFVSLGPAYEGTFSLSTSNFSPSVTRRGVEDPSGNGRKRNVDTSTSGRGVLSGSVSWSGRRGSGAVEVKSSNSPVILEL